jgi:hypothetical protein
VSILEIPRALFRKCQEVDYTARVKCKSPRKIVLRVSRFWQNNVEGGAPGVKEIGEKKGGSGSGARRTLSLRRLVWFLLLPDFDQKKRQCDT